MILNDRVLNTVSLEFSAVARKMSSSSNNMISLGLGEPGFDTPDVVKNAAFKSLQDGDTRYSSPWGIPELISGVGKKLVKSTNVIVESNEILITVGAKQALSMALMSILEPHDEVIVFTPCFVSFVPQIYLAEPNVKVVEICMDKNDFSVNLNDFEQALTDKTKAVIVNFPNNPTGKILTAENMRGIIELVSKTNAYLISDEIYSDLLINKTNFDSFINFKKEFDKLFIINGFSKSYAMTGWRIGYLYGPSESMKKAASIQQHLNTNVPVFIQKAALEALSLPDSFYEDYNNVLTMNESVLFDRLKGIENINYHRAQGGMFAFIDISKYGLDSDTFCTDLLRAKEVAITPGKVFGVDWDSHIRISLAGNYGELVKGVDRLVEFISELEVRA